MPEPEFFIKQGDTASPITAQLVDHLGAPVNISGAAVRFHMAPISGGTATIDQPATIVDAPTGQVKYTFTAPQTAEAGWYLAEWQVTFGSGAVQTFPNDGETMIAILPQLA